MKGILITMTGLLIGATLYAAASGARAGIVILGLALSIAGVFIIAWAYDEEHQ